MKKLFITLLSVIALSFASSALAADTNTVTITGKGECAKCALKESAKCQNVIVTEKDGKTVNYYLTKNEVSDSFHGTVCKEAKDVTATGTVKEVKGKMMLTATKIDLAK